MNVRDLRRALLQYDDDKEVVIDWFGSNSVGPCELKVVEYEEDDYVTITFVEEE